MYTYKLTIENTNHMSVTVSLNRHKFKVYNTCILVVKSIM